MQNTVFLKPLRVAILIGALDCCTNGYANVENTNCKTGDTAPPAVHRGILLLTQNSILTLQNANAQNGSFQEAPIDTPKE